MILDLYAGAGGWDVGAQILGLPTVGLEIEHDPCVTAVKAGHPRIRCDVATYPTAPFAGKPTGLVASPPCQAWSMAGNRLGELDRARVHGLVDAYAAGDYGHGGDWADLRSHHAAQPVRWIRDLRPDWVCLEQVPGVIDLWRHIGDVLRGWGYSVVTQVLCAADYGVPQTRERAILIASRVRAATMPETTHEKDPQPGVLFGAREPWVSMADALGITDPFEAVSNYGTGGDAAKRGLRSSAQPAGTVTSKAGRVRLRNNTNANACERSMDEPAGTLFFGRRLNNVSWVLHTNRDQRGDGTRQTVETDRPAPSLTGKSGGQWVFQGGEGQFEQDSLRVTVEQAALLQSFPADYPWAGNKTSQFLQVGNAIPPRLAAAVIGAAAGIDWQPAVEAFYAQPALGVAS